MTDQELYEAALAASQAAYAPYSKFLVGAAALLRDGRVVTGVNVDVYRNNTRIKSTPNDGFYTDSLKTKTGAYVYRICVLTLCSNDAQVSY